MLDYIMHNIVSYGSPFAYLILLLSAFVENVFPPFPGDLIVLSGGFLVERGALALLPVYVSTVSGSWTGFMLVYYLGSIYGQGLFNKARFSFLSAENLEKVEDWFARYGDKVILGNRFLSGVRSVVAVFAGIGGMKPLKVALYALISISVWNGLLLYLGMTFGSNWEMVVGLLRTYSHLVMFIVSGAIGVFLLRYYYHRRKLLRAHAEGTGP